jgi:hypothetical protein
VRGDSRIQIKSIKHSSIARSARPGGGCGWLAAALLLAAWLRWAVALHSHPSAGRSTN